MSESSIMRRPTEDEQRIIGAVYRDLHRLRGQRHHPVVVGMGIETIQDPERGRWSALLGLPVLEVPRAGVFLLLEVEVPDGG